MSCRTRFISTPAKPKSSRLSNLNPLTTVVRGFLLFLVSCNKNNFLRVYMSSAYLPLMQESLHPDCCCLPRQEAAAWIEDGRMKRQSVPGNLTPRGGRPSQGYFARRIYPEHTSDMGLRDFPYQLNNRKLRCDISQQLKEPVSRETGSLCYYV